MSAAETGTDAGVTSIPDTERVVVTPAGPAASPGPSRAGGAGAVAARLGTRIGLPVAVAGVITGIWYLVSDLVLNSYQRFMLPPPHRVLEVGFLTWSNFTALVSALGTTAEVTF